jgi:hypothetical protein
VQNAKQKTKRRRAPEGPEAVTEQKTGYITADTLMYRSKVLIYPLAAEVRSNRSAIQAARSAVRRAQFPTIVARRTALVRLLLEAQRQIGKGSRIGSRKRHRCGFGGISSTAFGAKITALIHAVQ